MASFPCYTILSGTKFRILINTTITCTFKLSSGSRWVGSIAIYKVTHSVDQNVSSLDLKLLTDSADTH